jgi:hypothetical protein
MEQFLIQVSNFYHSNFFSVVKLILGIYVAVLVIDIILIVILREPLKDIKTALKGSEFPLIRKSKMQRRWGKVVARLKSDNPSQYKAAILEADNIADEILAGIGYKGKNMAERLDQVKPAHLDNLSDDLRRTHEIRNRIIREKEFTLSREETSEIIGVYEKFLDNLEFI